MNRAFTILALFLLSFGWQLHAEPISLYDNLDIGTSPNLILNPFAPGEWAAQAFLTGDADNVSSATIDLRRHGNPSGELSIEIWDDNGAGRPGTHKGTVGTVDLAGLGTAWENITFNGQVTALVPESVYYVVLNSSAGRISRSNSYDFLTYGSDAGVNSADKLLGRVDNRWQVMVDVLGGNQGASYMKMAVQGDPVTPAGGPSLFAGDADQDLEFDQLDLVHVQVAGKYLTGQAATWGEGDWDGAPGGEPGKPPAGNGRFDQLDIVAALDAGAYLTGPYAAVQAGGMIGDRQTSVIYNAGTGELAVDPPAGVELTSINIDSASGIFTGEAAQSLGGSFDNDADANIFKATFGSSFGSLSFGNVAQAGLSEEFVLSDPAVIGSLAGGGDLGNVDLVYVPEPTSVLLLSAGVAIGMLLVRRANQ